MNPRGLSKKIVSKAVNCLGSKKAWIDRNILGRKKTIGTNTLGNTSEAGATVPQIDSSQED